MHGRRYELFIEQAGYSNAVMNLLRSGFQQVQVQDGVNAVMPSGSVRVNDNSIQITNPAGPGTNFFLGGDNNSYFDFSSSGGGGDGGGAQGPPGPPGATGATGATGPAGPPGSGAFWDKESFTGVNLLGTGVSSGDPYYITGKTTVDTETDIVPAPTPNAQVMLFDLSNPAYGFSLAGTKFRLTFILANLVMKKNDGGLVVGMAFEEPVSATIDIDIEEQSCPEPCP